jgi:hypothetical protein
MYNLMYIGTESFWESAYRHAFGIGNCSFAQRR